MSLCSFALLRKYNCSTTQWKVEAKYFSARRVVLLSPLHVFSHVGTFKRVLSGCSLSEHGAISHSSSKSTFCLPGISRLCSRFYQALNVSLFKSCSVQCTMSLLSNTLHNDKLKNPGYMFNSQFLSPPNSLALFGSTSGRYFCF